MADSKLNAELSEVRSNADYDVRWATDKTYAEAIVKKAADFVSTVLELL